MDPDLKQRWIWKGWSGWPTKTLICVFRHSVKAVNLVITTNQRVILSKFIYPKMVDLIAMFCHICFHWVRNKGSTSGKSSPRLKQKLSTAYCWWKMKFCFSSMLMTSWLCQKQSRSMKDFEICWKLNSRSKSLESPNTYWVSVLILWRMGFHFLNASILNKSYSLSPSTKETRSTLQWSPIWLPESFWNLKMNNSILTCTVSSSEVWRNSLPGQHQILLIPCQFFPNFFQIQLEDTGHWLEE